jgi:hypothetical protein
VRQLQDAAAPQAGRLLRVLLVRHGEVSADTRAARMLRLTCAIGVAAAMLSIASGCTWQQAYSASQTWQRNACNRLIEQTERERCLSNAAMTYEDYRRQTAGTKKD